MESEPSFQKQKNLIIETSYYIIITIIIDVGKKAHRGIICELERRSKV